MDEGLLGCLGCPEQMGSAGIVVGYQSEILTPWPGFASTKLWLVTAQWWQPKVGPQLAMIQGTSNVERQRRAYLDQ